MDGSHSTHSRFCCIPTNDEKDRTIDATLDTVDRILGFANDAASFVPVPGVGATISVLQKIVKELRQTRGNSKTANDLAKDVQSLAELIRDTVKKLNDELEPMMRSLSDEQKEAVHIDQLNVGSVGMLSAIVGELIKSLDPLPAKIQRTLAGNFFTRLILNSAVDSQLGEVRDDFAKAKEEFQTKLAMTTNATVTDVRAKVMDVLSRLERDKYDNDLKELPRAKNAGYDALGELFYLKGTRMGLIDSFKIWKNNPNARGFFILRGAAGTGKSTVTREICRHLDEEKQLGASFFFVRSDDDELGNTEKVIPTIAFQLANSNPAIRPYIANAAREFMKSPSGSIMKQMELLIIQPLQRAQNENPDPSRSPIVVVLDALDEAGKGLVSVLKALQALVEAHSRIRIFLSTRPESSITYSLGRAGINAEAVQDMGHIPQDIVEADIRLFLNFSFQKLRWRDALLEAYPYAIEALTKRAETLFIYAYTVIKHLDHKVREVSVRRLAAILDGSSSTGGLPALDELYASVLQNAYDDEAMEDENVRMRVTSVLAGLVLLDDQLTAGILAPMMGLSEIATISTIEDLRSIISCSGEDLKTAIIRPLHLTLREFLVDAKRCIKSVFHIERRSFHNKVAKNSLRTMNAELRRDICGLGAAFNDEVEDLETIVQNSIPGHLQYACKHWSIHLTGGDFIEDMEVRQLLEEFCKRKLLPWIEAMSLLKQLHSVNWMLSLAHSWTVDYAGFADVSVILYDGLMFAKTFSHATKNSAGQIYTFALSCVPDCTLVKLYANKLSSNCMVTSRDSGWGSHILALNSSATVVTYSCVSQHLVLFDSSGIVQYRDGETGHLLQESPMARSQILAADAHPNNGKIVTLSYDGVLGEQGPMFDSEFIQINAPLKMDDIPFRLLRGKVAFSEDGSKVVCYWNRINAILVWSTGSYSEPSCKITLPVAADCVEFSLNCDCEHMSALLTLGKSSLLKVWNIHTGKESVSQVLTTYSACAAAFAKNNTMLVTFHNMKTCVWNCGLDCSEPAITLPGRSHGVISQCGDIIASSNRNDIELWNGHEGALLAVYQGHLDFVLSLQFLHQKDRLISRSADGTVRIWGTTESALAANPPSTAHDCYFTDTRFSPNGEYIAAIAFMKPYIFVWDGNNGTYLTTLVGHTGYCLAIAFSEDTCALNSFAIEDGVISWNIGDHLGLIAVPKFPILESFMNRETAASFDAGVKRVAVLSALDGPVVVKVYQIPSSKQYGKLDMRTEIFQSTLHCRYLPDFVKFADDELPLCFRRPYAGQQIRIWDQAGSTENVYAFDDYLGFTWASPYHFDGDRCIVSTETKRRLGVTSSHLEPSAPCIAVHGDLLAYITDSGKCILLNLKILQSKDSTER